MKIQRHRLFNFLDFVLSVESTDSLEQLLIYQDIALSKEKTTIATREISQIGKSAIELLSSPQKSGFWLFSKNKPIWLLEADYCYADGPAWVEFDEAQLLKVFSAAESLISTEQERNYLIYYRKVFCAANDPCSYFIGIFANKQAALEVAEAEEKKHSFGCTVNEHDVLETKQQWQEIRQLTLSSFEDTIQF